MGSGASSNGSSAVNPRVEHAMSVAGKEKKARLIDAPTLIDVGHGTIRYRYMQEKETPIVSGNMVTNATIGGDVKRGYFYHAKLKDYSDETDEPKTNEYKFKYVYKEPNAYKGKRLFFVTKKLDRGNDSSQMYTSRSKLDNSSSMLSQSHDKTISFSLEHVTEQSRAPSRLESPPINEGLHHPIMLRLNASDTVDDVREKLSISLLIPSTSLRCYYADEEIRPDMKLYALLELAEMESDITVRATRLSSNILQ